MRKYLNQIGGGETLIYIFLAIAIAMIISMFIGMKTPKFRQDKKRFFIYILCQGLFLLIFGAILYNLKDTSLNARFISIQVYLLLAGSVHLTFFHLYFKKFEANEIYKEIFIAIVSGVFLTAFLIMILGHFRELNYMLYFIGTILFFLVPTFCFTLFQTAISIPAKLHKRWFYPVNSKYPTPQISEMRNIIIVNLVFTKKANDSTIINFKVKAPRAFDFGKLFYYFINDYNEKNPNSQVHYLDEKNQPFGWYFYTKPKWFSSSDYIDPDLAIDTNNIKDGETIICQRI
ncbi:TssN family type VI secretion system protein [uncultured Flavobacterium sp.]|uniref:TssN family type VI secretion system protein n=1 Tax=uncultured Flavobacterium sp. TaxID=165435 RepID=UPI0025E4412A|nr:TssN family type VI secretion system protein [uncultured Flavobacterium sp.]